MPMHISSRPRLLTVNAAASTAWPVACPARTGASVSRPARSIHTVTMLPARACPAAGTSPVRDLPSGVVHRAGTLGLTDPPEPVLSRPGASASRTARTCCEAARCAVAVRRVDAKAALLAARPASGAPARKAATRPPSSTASARSEARRSGFRSGHHLRCTLPSQDARSHPASHDRRRGVRCLILLPRFPAAPILQEAAPPRTGDLAPARSGPSPVASQASSETGW